MNIHLLDMGTVMYGDCIVITQGDKSILIDGAHVGDYNSIRMQLKKIFGKDGPYEFDLLIMTHCHADHIGCLPTLISAGDVTAKKALLADPKFRWGENDGTDAEHDGFVDALFEEDHTELDNADLEQFLFDSEQLSVQYDKMIKALTDAGTEVQLFQGVDAVDYKPLEKEFKSFGLKILGPTNKQLTITQSSLLDAITATEKFIKDSKETDDVKSEADLYRKILTKSTIDGDLTLDAKKNKGAINDHSIVIKVKADGWSALLAGDMQFADAEVDGLDEEMAALLDTVNAAGPYDFIKTSHHTSYNGLDEPMLDKWLANGTKLYGHSGGKKDDKHPEKTVLQLLKARSAEFEFARTDRNGIITISKDDNGKVGIQVEKGKTNVFTVNPKPVRASADTGEPEAPVAGKAPAVEVKEVKGMAPEAEKAIYKLPPHLEKVASPVSVITGNITIAATIPIGSGTVTITVEQQKKKLSGDDDGRAIIAQIPAGEGGVGTRGGRYNNLLFVTCREQLNLNIGKDTPDVMDLLTSLPGARVISIAATEDALAAAAEVRSAILPDTKGIVLIGGYNVVPSLQFNILNDDLRREIEAETRKNNQSNDPDDYIIWSDDIYGDLDGDFLPELPVSRIPDGKDPDLIKRALQAPVFASGNRFGVHNIKRPFAIDIFQNIPFVSNSKLEVSEKCVSSSILRDAASGAVYFMLHGNDRDATYFAGEKERGGSLQAFEIDKVPKLCDGTIVFSGCCWGALIVQPTAKNKNPETELRHRTSEQSIAMAYLKAGANAFVGCTGAHYSPAKTTENFFGKPMHDSFWREIARGMGPSQALLNAKKEYAANLPHNLSSARGKGIEIKCMHQFTCLGLGW